MLIPRVDGERPLRSVERVVQSVLDRVEAECVAVDIDLGEGRPGVGVIRVEFNRGLEAGKRGKVRLRREHAVILVEA